MLKKSLLAVMLTISCTATFAQVPENLVIMDDKESAEVDSLSSLVDIMNKQGVDMALDQSRKASWKRKTFFRLSWTKSTFAADETKNNCWVTDGTYKLDGTNEGHGNDLYRFKNQYGVSIMWGKNFSLHKNPLANMVMIALDYTWIDLNWNNYKAFYTSEGAKYSTSVTYTPQSEASNKANEYNYIPWGFDKNEVNYGMSLGPSITVAPFGYQKTGNARNLHFQVFYHLGYSASAIFYSDDKELVTEGKDLGFVGQWGHGLTNSWGMNISWKAIGIGFDKRNSTISYCPFSKSDYGSQKTKLKLQNTRWYITFNF